MRKKTIIYTCVSFVCALVALLFIFGIPDFVILPILALTNSKKLCNPLVYDLATIRKNTSNVILSNDHLLFIVTIIFLIICLFFFVSFIIIIAKIKQLKAEAKIGVERAKIKARQDFFSKMSHEIRTPMNAIIGLTDVVALHSNIPQDLQDDLKKIQSSAHYLLGLINNILDISKIEQGKMVLSNEPFSISKLVNSLNDMLLPEVKKFGVIFIISTDIKHDIIISDEIRLRQVITNLLSNAFKYTPSQKEVKLEIKELQSTDSNAKYYFAVIDQGIGIPQSEHERIFQPFEQIDSNISHSMGTGLGLPISQNIIRLMGGNIELNSQKNKGSSFSFTLSFPLGKLIEQNEITQDNNLVNKNILVVEDNLINAQIIVSFLEMKGANVIVSTNGKEALEAFRNSKNNFFDLIFMDIQMPIMNGLTCCKQMRMLKRQDAKKIPIIAMTANTFKEDVDNALNAGMNDFISKPIDVNKLFATIEKYI